MVFELMEVLQMFTALAVLVTMWLTVHVGVELSRLKRAKPFDKDDLERFITRLDVLLAEKERKAKEEFLSKVLSASDPGLEFIKNKYKKKKLDLPDGELGVYMSPELKESMSMEDEAYWRIEFSGEGERLEGEGPGGQYTDDQRKAYDKDPNVFWCSLEKALRIAKDRQDGGIRGQK